MSSIAVKIITERMPIVAYDPARGHGNNATETTIEGGVLSRITIVRDGKAQFGLIITDKGEVRIVDYAGMSFQIDAPSDFRLKPRRPWVE